MKVCHVTSAHPRYDIRIFKKMCSSLAENGFDVHLVVADGNGDELINNVKIVDAGNKATSRISRMTRTVASVYKKAAKVNANVYHLHDPELMIVGLLLRAKGAKVIFDAHEDLPKQLASKPYLNSFMRRLLPAVFGAIESVCFRFYSGLIGATPKITEKLSAINSNAVTVNNYPILGELNVNTQKERDNNVCYLGGISEIRGIRQMVESLPYLDLTSLNLAGNFSPSSLRDELVKYPGWNKVNELGMIDRKSAAELLSSSLAGLVLFHAVPNHVEAQPNKLFEYMSAGLPVISSNFEMWKEIVEVNDCGLCVDPMDPKAIADAVNFLIDNPNKAKLMGENGIKAVQQVYNWSIEEQQLLSFYNKLID